MEDTIPRSLTWLPVDAPTSIPHHMGLPGGCLSILTPLQVASARMREPKEEVSSNIYLLKLLSHFDLILSIRKESLSLAQAP